MATDPDVSAIIIEPNFVLAGIVADVVTRLGYHAITAATHAGGAAAALARGKIDLVVAAVPAPGESRDGAYLEEARRINPAMHAVVMLSDPSESVGAAPKNAVQIVKPFSVAQLERALDEARTSAASA